MINDFICKECGQVFKDRKDLHKHIKCHGLTMAEYYVKNFKKRDLLTGDLLPFIDVDSYFLKDFRNKENFDIWCEKGKLTKEYIKDLFLRRIEQKQYKDLPTETEIKTCHSCFLPKTRYIKKYFNSMGDLSKELGVNQILKDGHSGDIKRISCEEIEDKIKIAVDTREQLPIRFKNQTIMKLDAGDYTALGECFSNTFVDRKNPQDFAQTVTKDFKRFTKELARAKELGAYVFIVVENSIEQITDNNTKNYHKFNLEYVFGNMNKIQHMFPENCQFVFANSREHAKKIILKILYGGRSLWNTDLQFLLDK